ncbi:hypothetical protein CRENBAI_004692 [Crenichthys baileyi]|uniref:Uncharacterized protein n=1 Tax=Crenichthys baileyi TaxID=28760 RepID=A0AAV9R854_9TELE
MKMVKGQQDTPPANHRLAFFIQRKHALEIRGGRFNTERVLKDTREDKKDILRRQLMEGLLAKLKSALSQQPLNLDYLEFLTHHELIMFASFSEQIGGVSDILEALQNIHNLVQCEILANSMSSVDFT